LSHFWKDFSKIRLYYEIQIPFLDLLTFFLNESIKNLNRIVDFDLKIHKFREKLLNIQSDVEDLIFTLKSYLQDIENNESNLPEIQKRLFFLKTNLLIIYI